MYMNRLKSLAFVYASIFSLLIGLGAGTFLTISSELISLFWSKRTLTHPGLLLLQCLLFGLVIGLLQLKVGAYPKTIKQILAEFQETGKVEGASYIIWTCLGICSFAMWLKVFQIGFAPVKWTWQGGFLFSLRLAPVIILVCLLCEKILQGKPLFPRK